MKRVAIFDADGKMHLVDADEVKTCAPTAKCMKFWASFAGAIIVMILGVFFMIYNGTASVYFAIGNSLLTLGVGVLIPSPNYKDVMPKTVLSSRPVTPILDEQQSEDPELSTNNRDADTGSTDVVIDVRE